MVFETKNDDPHRQHCNKKLKVFMGFETRPCIKKNGRRF
jgi:hypothetical protein